MKDIDEFWLDDAEKTFHEAIDQYAEHNVGHSYEGQYVDMNSAVVVECLLKAGWTYPGGPN